MKLFRVIGKEEMNLLKNGGVIEGRDHTDKYNSFDFNCVCFFANPAECLNWVNSEHSHIIKIKIDKSLVTEGSGQYPDQQGDFFDTTTQTEYAVKNYTLANAIAFADVTKEVDFGTFRSTLKLSISELKWKNF